MNLIHILVSLIIAFPLFIPKTYKSYGIYASFILLFVLFGLQYKVTIDWNVYIVRWNAALINDMDAFHGSETVYKYIMLFLHPLGFFGYQIVWAVAVLATFYYYLRTYIHDNYAWMFFAIFILYVFHFAFTYIDTNRQTLAICFCMWGLYMVQNQLSFKRLIVSILLFYCAFRIHTSAIIASPLLLFPFICRYVIIKKRYRYLYVFVLINLLSNIIDFTFVGNIVELCLETNDSTASFSGYTDEILGRSRSIPEQIIYLILQISMIESFSKVDNSVKNLFLASIVYYALQGYATATMARAFFFYEVFTLFSIPILFTSVCINNEKLIIIKRIFICFFFAYLVFSYNKNMVESHYMLEGWFHFRTIFSAPNWI